MRIEFKPAPRPAEIAAEDWQNWQWQLRHRLAAAADFARYFDLTDGERTALGVAERLFKVQSTPYYASLADRAIAADPIRQMILPVPAELSAEGQQLSDPLGERIHSPRRRLVHRYPDRVLFLVTDTCGVYCRYCLRKYFTGHDEASIRADEYTAALDYVKKNRGIREVILSGGDPLTLSDRRLLDIVADLKSIEHVELIRIGTRMPVVAPMRITSELVNLLKAFHPIFIMTHFNHPRELTEEAAVALTRLVDNGFPVLNQMVLLRGINNHAAVVQALSRRLLRLRVKPYYMFQCDPSEGTAHFRTSIAESMDIQRELWGRLSGLALPNLSLDIPGGGGKVGLVPDFCTARSDRRWQFSGWDGRVGEYVNPTEPGRAPLDAEEYYAEWQELRDQPYGR